MLSELQTTYFLSVAETGNITKSAKQLYVSPPAVSRQIQAAEDALGLQLFARSKRGVRLLPAGERIRDALLLNRSLFDELVRSLRAEAVAKPRPLRFGLPTDWHLFPLLHDLQTALAAQYTTLTIQTDSPDSLLSQLGAGELDLVLAPSGSTSATISQTLERKLLYIDHLSAFYSAHWPIAQLHPQELSVLSNQPLLQAMESARSLVPLSAEEVCSRRNFRPQVLQMPNHDSVLLAVGAGLGWCLSSSISWPSLSPHFCSILLEEPSNIFAFWRAGTGHAAIPAAIACLEQSFSPLKLG